MSRCSLICAGRRRRRVAARHRPPPARPRRVRAVARSHAAGTTRPAARWSSESRPTCRAWLQEGAAVLGGSGLPDARPGSQRCDGADGRCSRGSRWTSNCSLCASSQVGDQWHLVSDSLPRPVSRAGCTVRRGELGAGVRPPGRRDRKLDRRRLADHHRSLYPGGELPGPGRRPGRRPRYGQQ